MRKKRSYIPIYEDVLPRVNALPYEQAGMILFLLGELSSQSPEELQALADSTPLSPDARVLWQEICRDAIAFQEAKKNRCRKNRQNALKRWNTQCEGQKNIIFEVSPASDPEDPELIAKVPGIKKDAIALQSDKVQSHTDATASDSIYISNNINTNTITITSTNTNTITNQEYEDAIASVNAIVPDQDIVSRLFRMNGCYDDHEAIKFYIHYSKRGWTTKEGRKLKDIQTAVRLWIHRSHERMTRHYMANKAAYDRIADEAIRDMQKMEVAYEKIG